MNTKRITGQFEFTPQEWEETILPLARAALEALQGQQARIPKRRSRASLLRLALGLPPTQWGDGERLAKHRQHQKDAK